MKVFIGANWMRTLYVFLLLVMLTLAVKRAPVRTWTRRAFSSSARASSKAKGPSWCDVAVAFQAKDRDENAFRPRAVSTGEDAFFEVHTDVGTAVGVADGVGGWAEAGYDSSAISRELCRALGRQFTAGSVRPKQMLINAYKEVLADPSVEVGGTTACLGVLKDHTLSVANLGDSWCGVFREGALVHETSFQTHNFNTPFQLAKIPQQMLRQAQIAGRRYIMDSAEDADEYSWPLKRDDLVVFATDGVTDNVLPQDIERFLADCFSKGLSLDETTQNLVKEVVKVSKDANYPSPFAQELARLTQQRYLGGKQDDVTVVVMRIN